MFYGIYTTSSWMFVSFAKQKIISIHAQRASKDCKAEPQQLKHLKVNHRVSFFCPQEENDHPGQPAAPLDQGWTDFSVWILLSELF